MEWSENEAKGALDSILYGLQILLILCVYVLGEIVEMSCAYAPPQFYAKHYFSNILHALTYPGFASTLHIAFF